MSSNKVLIISDLHAPFHHPDALAFLKWVEDKYDPTHIIQIGDIIDANAFSIKFDRDPNGMGGSEEMRRAKLFIQQLAKQIPLMTVLEGNHTDRIAKAAKKIGLLDDMVKTLPEYLEFPDTWQFSERLTLDGVTYIHGDRVASSGGNLMQNGIKLYMKNIVFGHYHARAGIDYLTIDDRVLWGMCVGCLVSQETYAFDYAKKSSRISIMSVGLVEEGCPRIIPMLLKKNGRWDKNKQWEVNMHMDEMSSDIFYMIGDIDDDMATRFLSWIHYKESRTTCNLTVYISTYGGNLDDAFTIVNAMKSSPHQIITVGTGKVMSAGVIILVAGDIRLVYDDCSIMSHQFTTSTGFQKYHELANASSYFKSIHKKMVDFLFKACRKPITKEAVEGVLLKETDTFLSAKDLFKLGYINKVISIDRW